MFTETFPTRKASVQPLQDIEMVSYSGQDPSHKKYVPGYDGFMNQLPIMVDDDHLLTNKIALTQEIMSRLSNDVRGDVRFQSVLQPNKFRRNIIAIESPIQNGITVQEGVELVIAEWGDGYTSPVHGHSVGYMHEELIRGQMRVNVYRLMPDGKVRPVRTDIVDGGVFVSAYARNNPNDVYKRQTLIHNFTSIGQSATLHYLPEHTRDGRDNTFEVEYYDESLYAGDVQRITSQEGMYLQKGDVVAVRSTNVPEYGDHFIIITGHPIMKGHGLRPQDVAIHAPKLGRLFDQFKPINGLTLLKLNAVSAHKFREFHGITIENTKEVKFPKY